MVIKPSNTNTTCRFVVIQQNLLSTWLDVIGTCMTGSWCFVFHVNFCHKLTASANVDRLLWKEKNQKIRKKQLLLVHILGEKYLHCATPSYIVKSNCMLGPVHTGSIYITSGLYWTKSVQTSDCEAEVALMYQYLPVQIQHNNTKSKLYYDQYKCNSTFLQNVSAKNTLFAKYIN